MTDRRPENKDTLFQRDIYPKNGFVFDTKVAEVFDDMLHRSIPHYQEVMRLSREFLLSEDMGPGGIFYDLGSSTGNFLLSLVDQDHTRKYQEYIGIDNSLAMVEKAKKKLKQILSKIPRLSKKIKVDFICEDILRYDYSICGGIVLHYTLQFIAPEHREEFLTRLYSSLSPKGLLILSEKVEESDFQLKKFFIDHYHDFKTNNHYTADEIARKKEALEKVLIPFTTSSYEKMLYRIGFREVAIAFKWYNFTTWFAVK